MLKLKHTAVFALVSLGLATSAAAQPMSVNERVVTELRKHDCTLTRANGDTVSSAARASSAFAVMQNYDFSGFATLGSNGAYVLSPVLCDSANDDLLNLAYVSEMSFRTRIENVMGQNDCRIAGDGYDAFEQTVMTSLQQRLGARDDLPDALRVFAINNIRVGFRALQDSGTIVQDGGDFVRTNCS